MRGPRTEMSDAEPTTDALEGGPPVRVSILVVSYQTRELTLACLRSVVEQSAGLDFELRLLDNASEDGSFEAIREALQANVLSVLCVALGPRARVLASQG